MAARKPLVNVSGNIQELASTDSLTATITAIGEIPFTVAAGTANSIPLTSGSQIPFYDAAGTQRNIALVADTAPDNWSYYIGLVAALPRALP